VPASSLVLNPISGIAQGARFDEATGLLSIPELGPNDSFLLTYNATSIVSGEFTNTAEITGHPGVTDVDSTPAAHEPHDDDVDMVATEFVAVGIDVRKQVEQPAGSGTFIEADESDGLTGIAFEDEPVTYRFVVKNTGDTGLASVALADDLLPSCDEQIGDLAPDEERTIECVATDGFAAGTHLNTVAAVGTATVGDVTRELTDSDTAEVIVATSADLALETTVDVDGDQSWSETELAVTGEPFQWRVVVTNETDGFAATAVVVQVRLPPGVAATGAAAGLGTFDITTGLWNLGTVPAGESFELIIDAVIDDPAAFATASGVNMAEIVAHDQIDVDSIPNNNVEAEDDQDPASVLTAGIELTKAVIDDRGLSHPADTVEDAFIVTTGANVTYELIARNTGTTPLVAIDIQDHLDGCAPSAPVGDTGNDSIMDPAESWSWRCTMLNMTADTVNTATVSGTPTDPADPTRTVGYPISDNDPAHTKTAVSPLPPILGFTGSEVRWPIGIALLATVAGLAFLAMGRSGCRFAQRRIDRSGSR